LASLRTSAILDLHSVGQLGNNGDLDLADLKQRCGNGG
jgi:hypothetical protein